MRAPDADQENDKLGRDALSSEPRGSLHFVIFQAEISVGWMLRLKWRTWDGVEASVFFMNCNVCFI